MDAGWGVGMDDMNDLELVCWVINFHYGASDLFAIFTNKQYHVRFLYLLSFFLRL
jgi:hypothetical protein